jgi:predicted dehydrogenase
VPTTKAKHRKTTRRRFLGGVLAAGSLLAARSWWPQSAAAEEGASANEQLHVGVIGTGVRGKYLIGNLPASVRVASICDCAKSRMAQTREPRGEFTSVLATFREQDAPRCTTHQDYRRMLDREKLDAVIIATPDHHHVLAAMTALQAGLDVYLEKPMTLTVREGRLLADMVQKTGRVLQVGSQQRTMEMNRFACELLRDGGLGKIRKVELPNYPGPMPNARLASERIPEGLDWNLFLGPTPLSAYNRKLWVKDAFFVGDLLWRGWDLWRAYSGHIMTNWGAHSVDMVQYALGRDDSGPVEVRVREPEDLRSIWESWSSKTPEPTSSDQRRFWPVSMRYEDGVEMHFVHGPGDIHFYGERGVMKMRRNGFEVDPPELVSGGPDPAVAEKWQGAGHVARPHLENWLDCIRTRKTPNAPVEVGHRTVTVCHLANIARELNRPLHWNPESEQFVDDQQANDLLDRPRRQGFELPT